VSVAGDASTMTADPRDIEDEHDHVASGLPAVIGAG
jgi:hypothetical protein